MSFLKTMFGKQDSIKSPEDFWSWFQKNEKGFLNTIKKNSNIEEEFFKKLSSKLDELGGGIYFLVGMANDSTAELILTADAIIKNIVFVEELVEAAPKIDGWIFTAHKPALDIKNVNIEMAGYKFNNKNLHFYANELADYPDEIDITVIHNDFTNDNAQAITTGTFIFLDNFLGELNFATTIDNLNVIDPGNAVKELIPIEKLKDFLAWRQKEFIEKNTVKQYNSDNANFSVFETTLKNDIGLVAIINSDLLLWNGKSSYPWILKITINYGKDGNNGMPGEKTKLFLDKVEDEILKKLNNSGGHLYVGRQTGNLIREVYFASADFRTSPKIMKELAIQYPNIDWDYTIYKDKYWRSFNQFINY